MIAEWTCCICRQFVVYKQQQQQQQSLVREKDLQILLAGNCSRLLPPPAAAAPLATVEQRVRRTQKLTTRCPLGAAVVESISKDSGSSSGERPASDLGIIDHRSSAARSKNGFQLRRKTPSHDQIAILKSIRYFLLAARVVIARLLRQRQVFAAVPA